ncbi:MAG: hypothetical protein ACXV8R_14055 [Acidimicrobiia bacterium]
MADAGGTSRVPWLFVLTLVATLAVAGVIVVTAVTIDDGHLVYLTDDPGIHLSLVHNLVHHGTWGVVPGVFESASSSPGWTLLLAGLTAVVPPLANVWPLIANLAAGVWLIWIFTTNQRLVDGRDRSWLAIALAGVLGVLVLYVPALALLGMEHTLQCALVLYAFVLLERLQRKQLTVRALAPVLGIIFLASTVRFESAFVAAGFAVAFLLGTTARLGDAETREHWTRATALRAGALVSVAGLAPLLVVGLVDWSFHRGFFPNSIVIKSALSTNSSVSGLVKSPHDLVSGLQKDPMVLACTLLAAVFLIWAWCGGSRRVAAPAIAFFVTALLHANFADFGWYERYQTYLVVVGVYLVFQILADIVPANFHAAAKFSLVIAILALSVARIDLTTSAPRASSNTYRQRYQLGKFFEREFDHQAVATTELGYSSLFHDGPIVDVLGLGSHEALDIVQGPGLDDHRLTALLDAKQARVFVAFAEFPQRPAGWIPVGVWILDERIVPGPYGRNLEFWAPPGAPADALRRKLHRFEPRLPSRVTVLYPRPTKQPT